MLFFNFLCLFYLMVLINSHTISKNIAHDEKLDDIVDSIHDVDDRRDSKPRHHRLHRYYRKDEKEDAATVKEKAGKKIQSTVAKLVPDATSVTKLTTTETPAPRTTKRLGFWQKFRYRGQKKPQELKGNEVYKRRVKPRRSYRKKYVQYNPGDVDLKYDDTAAFKGRKIHGNNNRRVNADKRKRDVSNSSTTERILTTRASSVFNPFDSKGTSFFKFSTIKMYKPRTENVSNSLESFATQINKLRKEYAQKQPSVSSTLETPHGFIKTDLAKLSPTTTVKTTTDVDFVGTAQIEALLNDIKIKAVQMVAEQSPAITDIITNTVTETTFEIDPMLTHINTPGYALSTFISIDNDIPFSKRTANVDVLSKANDTIIISNTEPTHHVDVRSINEDVYTIAQTLEDMLQKELKKVYDKVKGKISTQLPARTGHTKTTKKSHEEATPKRVTHTNKKPHHTAVTKPMTTSKIKPTKKHKSPALKQFRRAPKPGNNVKNQPKAKTSTEPTQTTFDDYVMLTLFEQILSKTHEDNVMKMITTQNIMPKHYDNFRLHKRTPATARVNLAENEQKLYDDIILPDDLLEYSSKTTPYSVTTETGAEDTSFESLSNKISYNDYVNGYKHYLKFQKEQGLQNFSNLVRYQAHRHHSVDDIGKFILSKIPQMPRIQEPTRAKRFFDDDIMEDQDISTKSDDSWFKKHFYLFIDNGPPRKFHTSQTVELKSPMTDTESGSTGMDNSATPNYKNKGLTEGSESFGESNKNNQESIEYSLEQLSRVLDERKNKDFTNIMPGQVAKLSIGDKLSDETRNHVTTPENSIFRFGSIALVDKLFGKGRRDPNRHTKAQVDTEELSEIDRKKRNTRIDIEDTDNLYTSRSNTLRSTVPNVIETRNKNYGYVDVNLIPRPTAIVKLRENKQKKGKFKNFFNKFRFRKRNKHKEAKKSERSKREYRVQRFNPLKRIKDLFKLKQENRPAATKTLEMPDYEMMTSHIDTFKPVKYNKVMTVEEIKGQIPNITEELHHSGAMNPLEMPVERNNDKSFSIEISSINPVEPTYEYDAASVVSVSPLNNPQISGSLKPTSKHHHTEKTNLKKLSPLKPNKSSPTYKGLAEFDAPEITYDPLTNKFETNYEASTPSLDEIRGEIDSLQMKLGIPDDRPELKSTSKSHSISSTTKFTNNYSVKKIFVPPHIQSVQVLPKMNIKAEPKDIKIQTKLTRIAKFPLSHFSHDHGLKINPVIDKPQIYEYANEDKSSHDKIYIEVNPEKIIRKKSLNTYVTVNPIYQAVTSDNEYYKEDGYNKKYNSYFNKPYPDYFNDLLMWHGDLLNVDKLTSPQWESILKGLGQDPEISTLSMIDMQRELMQMKDYLKIDESLMKITPKNKVKAKAVKGKKDKIRSNNIKNSKMNAKVNKLNAKKAQNFIKTVALKDDAVVKGKDVVIQGEAKYFHVIKNPEIDTDRYIKAADLLEHLNKLYFKSPAIKYNIEDKIHDTKRNGEFWIDNIETKNKNNKEQDILFLDTTLLAYDDGPDFLTDRPKHKKMSKSNNPLTSSKPQQNQNVPKPVAKTNQSPTQYFSTPLPMRVNDFEKFLKDNQLDVQSVTTPLVGMPKFIVNKVPATANNKEQSQTTTYKSASANNVTLVSPSSFVTINPLNFYYTNQQTTDHLLDQSKDTDNKNKILDDKRHKRYSEIRSERFFTFEPFRKKMKPGKVKKKIKLFEKRPTTTTEADFRYTVIAPQNDDDSMEKEVELTIINMNDVDQSNDKQFKSEESIKSDKSKHITTREDITTEQSSKSTKASELTTFPLLHKMHNTLLYNNKKDKNKEKLSKQTSKMTLSHHGLNYKSNVVTDDISTTTFHPMLSHDLLSNLNVKHPPKRVRISSHSYKYDIVYNEPRQQHHSIHSPHHPHHKYPYSRFTPMSKYFIEQSTSPNTDDPYTDEPFNTTNQVSTTQSIYSNDGFETMIPNWREKRRLKLFSNIKGKLKTLLSKKSKSTTSSPKARTPNTTGKVKALVKVTTTAVPDDHKAKREENDEITGDEISTNDEGFNVDFDFDIAKIVQKATSSITTKNTEEKQRSENEKMINSPITEADIPYLSPVLNGALPYSNIPANLPDLSRQTITITNTTTLKIEPLSPVSHLAKLKRPLTATLKEEAHRKATARPTEEVYFEPLIYDNKIYFEHGLNPTTQAHKLTSKAKEKPKLSTNSIETKLEKRDIQPAGKFTAKDVAALEVIVDLVKNTVNYEEREAPERDAIQEFTESYYQNHPAISSVSTSPKPTQGSNSIQVHIAIPYNLQVDKKRSLESFKVRRVFAAKMFSPVDLEYQVQSFEDNKPTSSTVTETEDNATPKMYLLIDANGSLAKGNFPLKPLKGNVDLSKVRVRQVTTKAFANQKAETTSVKSVGKITLSKDFVAAINKHLVQLYENLTALNESTPTHQIRVRNTNFLESSKNIANCMKRCYRRHINWEAVKKYFGHDRVCNCKCKANSTMCRACAASDAVISELIFEFGNLAKYMNDHCTEIQTYFWMNPSGGKKLRDTVHKVDQNLHDYYKRVRGKCQGRTCKTFSTCIDKRSIVKQKKMPKKYIGNPMIIDLQRLAYDIDTSARLGIRYTANFVEEGESLINTIGNCIKGISKREKTETTTTYTESSSLSTTNTKKTIAKNIYSLDNINVNIICKPGSKEEVESTTTKLVTQITEGSPYSVSGITLPSTDFYFYDPDEISYTKRTGFRSFFKNKKLGKSKMNNIFTYYVTKELETTTPLKIFDKRQAPNQIETPLVSDSGGTFWHDYLKGFERYSLSHEGFTDSNKPSTTEDSTVNSNGKVANSSSINEEGLQEYRTTASQFNERVLSTTANPYPEKHVYQRHVNTTDYASVDTLSHNINELFKIFHNLTDLKEIENMSTLKLESSDNYTTNSPKTKPTNTTKLFKNIKDKLHFKHKNVTKAHTSTLKTTIKTLPTFEDDGFVITTKTTTAKAPTTTPHATTTTTQTPTTTTMTTTKTIAKITTATSKPTTTTLTSTTNHRETSSETTHKEEEESIESESSKQETTISEPTEDENSKSSESTPKVTGKATKSNFLLKFKSATLDFFHNKVKDLRKSTTSSDTSGEIRKSRSSSTEINLKYLNKNEKVTVDNNNNLDDGTHVISDVTTTNSPTILILNEYDSEMEPDFGVTPDDEALDEVDKDSNKDLYENFRSLLLSILNFEAKKISNEWQRFKKNDSATETTNTVNVSQNSKRGILDIYISTPSALKTTQKEEHDYDIMKTLKDLELPTPPGLDTESKGSGFLQKIANKFSVKVVPDTHKKPKVPATEPTTSPSTTTTTSRTTKRKPKTKSKNAGTYAKTTKPKSKNKKLKLKYTTIINNPIVSVNIHSDQEAPKSHSGQVCDIEATFRQIQQILQVIPGNEVVKFISNKTCDKYKPLPKYFLIDLSHGQRNKKVKYSNGRHATVKSLKWDWIRKRRSIKTDKKDISADMDTKVTVDKSTESKSKVIDKKCASRNKIQMATRGFIKAELTKNKKPVSVHNEQSTHCYLNQQKLDTIDFKMEDGECFEALEKDAYGIYRSKNKRRKRANNIYELEMGLKNLPFSSPPNESFAMVGDSVILRCTSNKVNARDKPADFKWVTDRKDMLTYGNVIVDGTSVMIKELEAKNSGYYTCQKGNAAQRRVKLTAITLPTFIVVFSPVYSVDGNCTYDDLRAVQSLGSMMTREVCSHDQICSVTVDEPVCLRDRVTNTAYLRLTAVMSVPPHPGVVCGGRCRRDLHDSIALMAAETAPALASVGVIIKTDEVNKTLVPTTSDHRRTIVTHTLRRNKDSINRKACYRSHAYLPETVNVVASCPAGFYLIANQKICAACPAGSWSKDGDNACAVESPAQAHGSRLRRCYWWCPSCGWCAAGWGAACACAGAAALLHARAARAAGGPAGGVADVHSTRVRTPRARPLSPSRVILAKFLRGSRSSTKATDSQETKFGLWKEKNIPPPLPPIDFDL